MIIRFLLTNLRLASVEFKEKDMRLLIVHTHTFVEDPCYRIQYRDAYYISIEGGPLCLGNHPCKWHEDWFMEWNTTKRE